MLNLMSTVPDVTALELEKLSDPALGIMVEAWVTPNPTTELCSQDTLHGPGMVQVALRSPIVDITQDQPEIRGMESVCHAVCLKCALELITARIQGGESWISVEVTR